MVCRKFIARTAELEFLHEQRLLAGKAGGRIVLLTGDAGIGKTRLIREFCKSLGKSRWKIGFGLSLEYAQRPYGPILDILEACDRDGAGALLPASTKREQFDAIAERLARIASKTAVIGVVEDIHWADTGTLELLAFLATKIERQRVLLLASFRRHELDRDHPNNASLEKVVRVARCGRIDLEPLDESALRIFIDETLKDDVLPTEIRRLVSRTSEGNPFFAEELLKAAIERTTSHATASVNVALPSSIRETLLERYRRLESVDREVLAQAAVIGPTFRLPLLIATLTRTLEEILSALLRARGLQLIEEVSPTVFRFRHALTRRAIYEGFLGVQAWANHRSIAIALERLPAGEASIDELAYHWWAANDGDRSALFNTRAGDAAASVHAHEDAIALYERALESPSLDAHSRATVVEKIADRYQALGLPERRHATYMQAAELYASVGDDDNEAQCCVRGVISAYTAGNARAVKAIDALLARLPRASYVARARAHLGLAWLEASFSFPREAIEHLERVDERAKRVVDVAQRYHNVAAWVAMTLGNVETFLSEYPLWVDAAVASGLVGAVASARLNGAACFAALGLHEEAISQCLQSIELARSERNLLGEEAAYGNLANVYLQVGNIPAARAVLAKLSHLPESAVTIANASAAGTLVGAHLGDEALIDRWFEPAGEALVTFPDADSGAGYAEILVRRGKAADARAALRRAIPKCEYMRGNMRTLVMAAKYGDPDDYARARAMLVTAADSPSDVPEKAALALFDAYVARRAGDGDRARAQARAAAKGFKRLRYPLFEAAAMEAAEEFEEARAIFLRCGAIHDARRLLATSAERDDIGMSKDVRIGFSGRTLSPREREIVSLVAHGKSNMEIGRTLGISHKTVEKHLSSLYQKLGTSSRIAVARLFAPSEHSEFRRLPVVTRTSGTAGYDGGLTNVSLSVEEL